MTNKIILNYLKAPQIKMEFREMFPNVKKEDELIEIEIEPPEELEE